MAAMWRLLTMPKLLGRPLGAWIALGALLFASVRVGGGLLALAGGCGCGVLVTRAMLIVEAPVLIIAIVALIRRWLMARLFGGMAMALLAARSVEFLDIVGIFVAVAGLLSLIAIRRWYDERLPRMGW